MSDYVNEYLADMITIIGEMKGKKDPVKLEWMKGAVGILRTNYNKERLAAEKEKPESQRRKDFSPEPEPLISQLETLMRDLRAEEKESQIEAAVTAISVFTSACETARNKFLDPGAFRYVLKDLNPIEGNTLTTFRTVQSWLMKEGNQKLKNWPKILNAQCKGYNDMMLAFARVNLYAHDSSTLAKYIEDPRADNAEKARRKVDVRKLQQIAQARFVEAACNDDIQLNFLKKVVPAAQNRGMFWMIGENARLYAGTNIKEGKFYDLGVKGNAYR